MHGARLLSPKHCVPLLCYSSTLKITSIHSALCFMKILPYSKIRLLQTGCLRIAMRVARSYYNARLHVAGLRCVLFTYFLKGCSWHETNLMWIFDINLLLIIAREILTVILKLSFSNECQSSNRDEMNIVATNKVTSKVALCRNEVLMFCFSTNLIKLRILNPQFTVFDNKIQIQWD